MSVNIDLINGVIDVESALKRVNGNKELLSKLLDVMKVRYLNSHFEIVKLLKENKYEDATLLVHTIKGAAGNLSITELYNSASKLESGIKLNSSDLDELLEEYRASIEKTLKVI